MIQPITNQYNINKFHLTNCKINNPSYKTNVVYNAYDQCTFKGNLPKNLSKQELGEVLKESLEKVAEIAKDLPGTDTVLNKAQSVATDLLTKAAKNGGEFLVDNADEVLSTVLSSLPCAGYIRVLAKTMTGESTVKLKDTACIIDNTLLLPIKSLVSELVSNITAKVGFAVGTSISPGSGSVVGGAVGKVVGYIGILTVWAKTRDRIADEIEKILKDDDDGSSGSSGTSGQGVKMKVLIQKVYSILCEGEEYSDETLEQIAKSLGLKVEELEDPKYKKNPQDKLEDEKDKQSRLLVTENLFQPEVSLWDRIFNTSRNPYNGLNSGGFWNGPNIKR